jgi:hypothetical protein
MNNTISEYVNGYYAFLAYKYVYSQMQVHDSLCDGELWDKCREFADKWRDWDRKNDSPTFSGYDSFMDFIEIASHDEDELL